MSISSEFSTMLGVQDDFCMQLDNLFRSCLEIRILEVALRLWSVQGAMGAK
ncbi:MAG: hypothetical protein BECKG1743F_GA0114225_111671, partial [Candidatus Kentron sp. G]